MPKVSQSKQKNQPRTAIKSGKPLYQSKPMSPRSRVISLVLGDSLCFLVFAALGSTQHGKTTGITLLTLPYIISVAIPFLLGWFLVSPFIGAFKADIALKPKQMIIRTALSWLAAWPVAMLIRWLLVDRLSAPAVSFGSFLSFAIVAFIFNMALLLIWRGPFALNNELRSRNF
ncbi:MAG: DUF3054 domain-containing protein [Ktedonobacteraceae bacterium]